MKIHYFQHVGFEDPAHILTWARQKGHTVSRSMLHAGDDPLAADDFNMLVVMGGPMNIYEYDRHPWLAAEKLGIKRAIERGAYVLGICLGAQLIADAFGGAPVVRNEHAEIGWFPVVQTREISGLRPFDVLPGEYMAFHWHGDTFGCPAGAIAQSYSEGCANQGFMAAAGRVIGLQYHLEATPASVDALIDNCGGGLTPGRYVHPAEKIRRDTTELCGTAQGLVEALLDRWIA